MLAGTWPRIVLKIAFAGSESSTNLAVSCCSKFSRASSLDLTFADTVPSVNVELASSPSSSETSTTKENKLSRESCS
jgi:hypothetical protein